MEKGVAAALVLFLLLGCLQYSFKGVAVSPPKPAPDFVLVNQFGEKTSLSDFRGRVVAMSFIYSSCTTICPIITSKFIKAAEELDDIINSKAVFIVITVDPERDTVDRVKKYSKDRGMLGKWQYLTGEYSDVEKVWRNYNVFVNKSEPDKEGKYTVDHTGIVYVIGKEGNLRLMYSLRFDPRDLASDMRQLSEEK
jgi:protein SCO1/2